jgi:hypothetical protein
MRSSVIKASATKTIVGSFVVLSAIVLLLNLPGLADQGSSIPRPAAKLYTTAKQKLLDDKQIYCYTITKPDTDLYCQVALRFRLVENAAQHVDLGRFRENDRRLPGRRRPHGSAAGRV